jgi:hypothetical protein
MAALRMLVVIEPGRAGDAAVEEACAQAWLTGSAVTLVAVAPLVATVRCGPSGDEYNGAVIDAVTRDLTRACDRLAGAGVEAECSVLVDGSNPSLEAFAAGGGFDLILLPSRRPRWRHAGHPVARRLTGMSEAEVRLVARP